MEDHIFRIGIDVGYGDVKTAVNFNGKTEYFKFPTAVAYAKDGLVLGGFGTENAIKEYEYNGRNYRVGHSALKCSDIFYTRDISFLLTYAPLLIYASLERIADIYSIGLDELMDAEKQLCIGLPLAYWEEYESRFAGMLAGFRVAGRHVRFDAVEVLAQGQGVLVDFVIDDAWHVNGERANCDIVIVDIGFNTIDVLCVEEGTCSKEWSDMIEGGGICRICESVGNILQKSRIYLPEQAVKDVLMKKQLTIYGQTRDFSGVIRNASEAYTDMLEQEIRSRWSRFLQRADRLIIAGGGAYYLSNFDGYPPDFVEVSPLPEYSNSRGFIKYLVGSNERKEI
ncbi:MAG: ParM/StbA family protein [Candidatus Altiarchaeota archaeon]|nr:ParM/StbA family protein [Candidatus Altiarchaeota archaeon]